MPGVHHVDQPSSNHVRAATAATDAAATTAADATDAAAAANFELVRIQQSTGKSEHATVLHAAAATAALYAKKSGLHAEQLATSPVYAAAATAAAPIHAATTDELYATSGMWTEQHAVVHSELRC